MSLLVPGTGKAAGTRRRPTGVAVPAALAGLLVLIALAGPWLPLPDPAAGTLDDRLLGPGAPGHLLGTDSQGRDLLARLVAGARPSLVGGVLPVAVAALAGTALGAVAGLGGRVTEHTVLRALDVLYAFPGVLLALTVATVLEPGLPTTVVSLSIVLTPAVARVVLTEVRRVRTAEYLEAARVGGASRGAVLLFQVAPVVAPAVLVYCSSLVGLSVVYAAGLSFLGLGTPPPAAEWGAMLDELRPVLLTHPGVAVLPALAVLFVSVVFNTLGDALRRRTGDGTTPPPETVR
ncbi:ABC transporter permease [Streptomyces yaizuensis]|uniref:ABC transporter permease n=1 Tax=Streptomyces yaizuensis TaxID=2989713 RepID=A0ABQ5NRP2_9ACTN|nr:ABC transporter permease [Streptomyces sp. YSPA8]GLF93044.1 ABC transporter permease [Streptomyces sp. YSPA8]